MNRTKFILVMAGISLALAFTFGCSSDGGSENEVSSSSVGDSSSSSGDTNQNSDGNNHFNPDITYGMLSYAGKNYRTVKIGDQTWMAENLNHEVAGSKCYGENSEVLGSKVLVGRNEETGENIFTELSTAEVQDNCTKYGRLYDWATAMNLHSSCNSSVCADQVQTNSQGICPQGWHIPSDEDWDELEAAVGKDVAGTKLKAQSGWYDGDDDYIASSNASGFSALPGGPGKTGGYFSGAGMFGGWWSSSESYSDGTYFRLMFYCFEDVRRDLAGKSFLLYVRCVQDQD